MQNMYGKPGNIPDPDTFAFDTPTAYANPHGAAAVPQVDEAVRVVGKPQSFVHGGGNKQVQEGARTTGANKEVGTSNIHDILQEEGERLRAKQQKFFVSQSPAAQRDEDKVALEGRHNLPPPGPPSSREKENGIYFSSAVDGREAAQLDHQPLTPVVPPGVTIPYLHSAPPDKKNIKPATTSWSQASLAGGSSGLLDPHRPTPEQQYEYNAVDFDLSDYNAATSSNAARHLQTAHHARANGSTTTHGQNEPDVLRALPEAKEKTKLLFHTIAYSRKTVALAWLIAFAPPFLFLLIYPIRSAVDWDQVVADVCVYSVKMVFDSPGTEVQNTLRLVSEAGLLDADTTLLTDVDKLGEWCSLQNREWHEKFYSNALRCAWVVEDRCRDIYMQCKSIVLV